MLVRKIICLFTFVTCTLGVFHIIHDEKQQNFDIVGNFTTTTVTECILLCNQVKKCDSILDWKNGKCILLKTKKMNNSYEEKDLVKNKRSNLHLAENDVKIVKEVPRDVAFTKELDVQEKICCSWGQFTPCDASCGSWLRMRRRTCERGGKIEIEREEIDVCYMPGCPCMWKSLYYLGVKTIKTTKAEDWQICQKKCAELADCKVWAWTDKYHVRKPLTCWLESLSSENIERKSANNVLFGLKHCTNYPN